MPSLNTVLTTATLLLSSAQAQIQYHIDPSSVSLTDRDTWCSQELSTCPLICQDVSTGTPQNNDCDPKTLTYSCICEDGNSPNLTQYSLTLPFFICQEWGTQCVANCSDSLCASDCRQNHPCGALSPQPPNKTITASSTPTSSEAAASTSAGQIFDGLGDGTTDKPKSGASPLLQYGNVVGAVALSIFVGLGSLVL
ncbi:hypothetical protein GGR50DRAFT_666053 [Xylaria sp. CBS 124048]|nr:hypothetical protein GGR50DRAFT_666053 [Xylaria sp. CBS 124048]